MVNSLHCPNTNGNGLLLYYHWSSFYSQKVLLALTEKKLKYRLKLVDLAKMEQYQPWFMALNPAAEVPVLKDSVKVIPDSTRIIEYLEDNFSNGDTPRLWPERATEAEQLAKYFTTRLSDVPIEIITFGCVVFPELTKDMKMQLEVIARRKAMAETRLTVLLENSTKYPDFKDNYLNKREKALAVKDGISTAAKVHEYLSNLIPLMDEIERELSSHTDEKTQWWLCSDKFTVADIILAVLLNRLDLLGLGHFYWLNGKRPCVDAYLKKLHQRESFRKVCLYEPNILKVMKYFHLIKSKMPLMGTTVVALAAIAAGAFVYRRLKAD